MVADDIGVDDIRLTVESGREMADGWGAGRSAAETAAADVEDDASVYCRLGPSER